MSILTIPVAIESRILLLRGTAVMIDRDLAELYQVSTKALNQAVKRNALRFPADFIFQLTQSEKAQVVTICDHLKILRFSPNLPYAFTEHGAIMLASVLNSARAVESSVFVVRAFVKLRQWALTQREFSQRLAKLERQSLKQGADIRTVFEAMRKMTEPPLSSIKQIGFRPSR